MVRLVLTLATSVLLVAIAVPQLTGADEEDDTSSGPPPCGERGEDDRPPPPRRRPPPPPPRPPLETALDADDDGEISAEEIAGAVAALTKADHNSDGKLTGDEVRPPHPPHHFGPPPRRGGPPRE